MTTPEPPLHKHDKIRFLYGEAARLGRPPGQHSELAALCGWSGASAVSNYFGPGGPCPKDHILGKVCWAFRQAGVTVMPEWFKLPLEEFKSMVIAARTGLLRGCNLAGFDFSGANLTGANFSGADLSGADFSGAKLSGAKFIGANLSGADPQGTDPDPAPGETTPRKFSATDQPIDTPARGRLELVADNRQLSSVTGMAKVDDGADGCGQTFRAVRSPEEIAAAILALTPAQHRKLSKIAFIYGGTHIEPRDLLQMAFHLSLEDGSDDDSGRRRCPVDVDVVTFLCGIMRSVSHDEREKQKRRGIHVVINTHGQALTAIDPIDPRPDQGELADAWGTYRHVLSLFADDPEARVILEGIAMGLDAEEIRKRTGLGEVAYQSKRRQIRRIIGRAYPKGWSRG
jgi:hypothetical protein